VLHLAVNDAFDKIRRTDRNIVFISCSEKNKAQSNCGPKLCIGYYDAEAATFYHKCK